MSSTTISSEIGSNPGRIQARKFKVDFSPEKLDRIWIKDDPFLTAWLNAYTMTIPDGESLIVRTLRYYLDDLDSPHLRNEVLGLVGQELTHSQGHGKFLQLLRDKGYQVDRLFKFVHFLNTKILEPTSVPITRLAFVVGIERINELIAEISLRSGKLSSAPPEARILYEWHFAEEIEHKSVAFDLYKAISGNKVILTYGIAMCYLFNLTYLVWFTATFLWQDRRFFSLKTWKRAFGYFFLEEKFLLRVTQGCLQVFKSGFHPSQAQNGDLAQHILSHREITVETVGMVQPWD